MAGKPSSRLHLYTTAPPDVPKGKLDQIPKTNLVLFRAMLLGFALAKPPETLGESAASGRIF